MDGKKSDEVPEPDKLVWRWLYQHRLARFAVPITVLLFIAGGVVAATSTFDGIAAFYRRIHPIQGSTTLSKPEIDAANEWVIILETTEDRAAATDTLRQVQEAYAQSGDGIWPNDFLEVRDPRKAGRWLVVLDAYSGASTCVAMRNEITDLQSLTTKSRAIQNGLGRWIDGAAPLLYSIDTFSRTYGRVENFDSLAGKPELVGDNSRAC